MFYPEEKFKIIVIDDNSNYEFIKAEFEYKNVEYVQSEFPKRGELLPYYYFYKNHYFDNAVILHDSVFFHKKIMFEKIKLPVIPLWHFDYEKDENIANSLRITKHLNNNNNIIECLLIEKKYKNTFSFMRLNENIKWNGCFGVQTFINHNFLSIVQKKYNFINLLNVVHNRSDRCCLERVMGIIFNLECPELIKVNSIMGVISKSLKWGYTYKEYMDDLNKYKKSKHSLVKVWTGR